MHINKLVLDNFKSFGRRTEIPFYEDFTTVSGPNGSGKSNIIDAVLFALGLARSQGIRADKLTDLIYNPGYEEGDEPPGPEEASVEVFLDNTDRTLSREQIVAAAGTEDIESADRVRVKRRVKRTEDNYYSYYYLNGRSVNLSDIRDLLSQAGVRPEGYNVVMQGDVTGITNMTPYRRREIVDEIAGVAEFDAKKADSMDELEVVKERIEEAELRIEEKESRLDQLREERETALQYQELREEKEEYESYLKAAELEGKRDDLAATEDDIEARREELSALQEELDERQAAVSELEDELDELNREIERKGEDEQLAIQREIESVKGEIARLEGEIDATKERIEETEARRREAFVELDRKQERIDELDAEIREKKLEKASLASEVQTKESALAEIEAEIDEIGTEYEDLKADLDAHKEALEAAKAERNDLQREQDRLLDEARRRSNEQAEIEADVEAAEARLPELRAEREDVEAELEKARHNLREIQDVIVDLRSEKTSLQAELEEVEDELRASQQEYAELEANADDNGDTSYGRAVTTILNAELDGIHGTVAQLGSVSDQYATACETAAGGRLANVVVADDEVGQRCIEHLKSRNAGRATFLPITKMDQRSLPRLPDREGVVDFAYNLVDFDDRYAGIFSYVLGDTLVVDTLSTARALMGDYRLVTLSGDLVERSGAMTGGSRKGSRYSFTKGGKGQLQRVAERIHELEERRSEVRGGIASIEERLEDARDRKSDAAESVRDVEAEIESIDDEREGVEDRIDALESRLAEIEAEREDVDQRMGEIEADIATKDDEIESVRADIEAVEEELADSRIPELSAEAEAIQDEIDELSRRIDGVDGTLNELQLERGYAEDAVSDLHDAIEDAQNRKAEGEARIEEIEGKIGGKEETLDEKRAAVEELEEELADLKGEREDLRAALRDAQAERDETRDEVARVENRIEGLEAATERLEAEIEELAEAVEDYDPEEIPDHEEVRTRIDRLELEMERLEPVNMLAIDEYDAVSEELADLEERKDTLVEERDGIRERIESYERQKKETFMEAFDGIDEYFRDIFSRLSGGSGELHLENPEDPFEAGLTMKAKPGDKPVQRLDAMSGGEKSLTALAFIFAIQRYNPAPFYALDEVDAFLDAANAERVGQMLDELADRAQFIVVSHRSAMLERSERAIGVTMQDDNVSAVTGIAMAADGGHPEGTS